jgi:DNA-binding NarL/FixJ family response regulator
VVIGEDEALLRDGLALVLQRAGAEVLATVGDGVRLEEEATAREPDLIVTDIRMPPTFRDEGLRAALDIRARRPEIAILVLSHYVQRRYADSLLASSEEHGGGLGYLLKQRVSDVETFCDSVRRVAAGDTVIDPEVVGLLTTRASRTEPLARLTARQLEVLDLMAQGHSNAAIAEQLVVTERAVVSHTSHIYEVLGISPAPGVHRRVLAVLSHLARDRTAEVGGSHPLASPAPRGVADLPPRAAVRRQR